MCFVLGEDFHKAFILFKNRWSFDLSDFVDSREILRETDDFIEVQDVNFVVGIDLHHKTYCQRNTWRFLFQETTRIIEFFPSNPLGDSNL